MNLWLIMGGWLIFFLGVQAGIWAAHLDGEDHA